MLIGEGWSFIHIPKCGGTAIRSVLKGMEAGNVMPLGDRYPIDSHWHWILEDRPPGRIFTVVRHPADWIRSYWLDQSPHRIKGSRYLHRYWSDDLDEFVSNLCEGHPGYVGGLYNACMPYTDIRVFLLEDGLTDAVSWALQAPPESKWANATDVVEPVAVQSAPLDLAVPVLNATSKIAQMSEQSRKLIAASEEESMKLYGYL